MGLGMRMSMKTRMRRMKMSDFLLHFSWVLFRPVGFCCRRPDFWAGLVLGWVGPGWVGLGWVGPGMNWSWDGLLGFCARYTRGLV